MKMHCVLQVSMSRVQANATAFSKVFNIEEKHSLIGNSVDNTWEFIPMIYHHPDQNNLNS